MSIGEEGKGERVPQREGGRVKRVRGETERVDFSLSN